MQKRHRSVSRQQRFPIGAESQFFPHARVGSIAADNQSASLRAAYVIPIWKEVVKFKLRGAEKADRIIRPSSLRRRVGNSPELLKWLTGIERIIALLNRAGEI